MIENTKIAAYLIWEVLHSDNTLALWRCAESIGRELAKNDVYSPVHAENMISEGINSVPYKKLVALIAYQLFVYTGMSDWANWFNAEKLLNNPEWRLAEIALAFNYKFGGSNENDAASRGDSTYF